MILALAWKALVAHPVRTAVLGVGFGLGVGVMATLLGVGEVVLEQARAPALAGGGQFVVGGVTGSVTSARFVLDALRRVGAADASGEQGAASASAPWGRVVASPRKRADLYLVHNGRVVPVRARAGIPSLERALGDPETAGVAAWVDTAADQAWASPAPGDLLRAMDRFHAVPDVPGRAASWAEWLYFKGLSGREGQERREGQEGQERREGQDGRQGREKLQLYVTFLSGPLQADGRRAAGVHLQLDRGGRVTTFSDADALDADALVASAPDVTIGRSRVRLEGSRYHIMLDLPATPTTRAGVLAASAARTRSVVAAGPRVTGDIFVDAIAGRSLPPIVFRGAGGWLSGYTVPVMSGRLSGALTIGGERVTLDGSAYHDHNWGFWEGVSWRWGQVQHEGLSYLYGRVFPPADAADAERVPGFLMALGPDGPVGYATRVTIDETDDPATHRPRRIVVQGRSGSLDLRMELAVENLIVNRGTMFGGGADFLQLRARYRVSGRAGDRTVDFSADGAAETFRGK